MKHVEVVCAIIKNDNNEIFCCQRGPGRALEGYWEFPGGKVEPNETHEETIVREIKEELNSIVKPVKYLGKVYYEYKNLEKPFSITMYGYLCSIVKGELILTEHTAKAWITIDKLADINFANADIPFVKIIKSI